MAMNELGSQVRTALRGKDTIALGFPLLFGIIFGIFTDILFSITGKNLPVSCIKVNKFASSTEFQSELVTPDPNREIFYKD